MSEAFMQARMILALVDLTECPIEKVSGLAGANGQVAGADIEKMQRMIAAIGDAAAKTFPSFHDGEAEGMLDLGGARDRGGGSGEATTNDAHMQRRPPHLVHSLRASCTCESCGTNTTKAGYFGIDNGTGFASPDDMNHAAQVRWVE